jgi:hypothetical protein
MRRNKFVLFDLLVSLVWRIDDGPSGQWFDFTKHLESPSKR